MNQLDVDGSGSVIPKGGEKPKLTVSSIIIAESVGEPQKINGFTRPIIIHLTAGKGELFPNLFKSEFTIKFTTKKERTSVTTTTEVVQPWTIVIAKGNRQQSRIFYPAIDFKKHADAFKFGSPDHVLSNLELQSGYSLHVTVHRTNGVPNPSPFNSNGEDDNRIWHLHASGYHKYYFMGEFVDDDKQKKKFFGTLDEITNAARKHHRDHNWRKFHQFSLEKRKKP